MSTLGKVLRIIYCEVCKKPTHKHKRTFTKPGNKALCLQCYRKYGNTFDWSHWP